MPTRRVTANLPTELLRTAQEVTGKGITDTLVEGLELPSRRTRPRAGANFQNIAGNEP